MKKKTEKEAKTTKLEKTRKRPGKVLLRKGKRKSCVRTITWSLEMDEWAENRADGNVSKYLRGLVERDMRCEEPLTKEGEAAAEAERLQNEIDSLIERRDRLAKRVAEMAGPRNRMLVQTEIDALWKKIRELVSKRDSIVDKAHEEAETAKEPEAPE